MNGFYFLSSSIELERYFPNLFDPQAVNNSQVPKNVESQGVIMND